MATVVFLGHRFVSSPAEARISLFDRGYLFGDSVFETIRAYRGVPFALAAHLDLLESAADVTGIRLPLDRDALGRTIDEAIRRSGAADAYVRVTLSRGEGGTGLGTVGCDAPVLSIIVKDYSGYPASAYERGIDADILSARKIPAACLDPTMKTGSYLPNVLARRELERRGGTEGIMLSVDGNVVSGTASNLFLVQGDRLRTPDAASGCRLGVTRGVLLALAESAGFRAEPGPMTVDDLALCEEAFFSNTLMECLPIRRLLGRELASGRTGSRVHRLRAAFSGAVGSGAAFSGAVGNRLE